MSIKLSLPSPRSLSRFAAFLAMSTALYGPAMADQSRFGTKSSPNYSAGQSLYDLSPDQVATDVEARYDPLTGRTEYIAKDFDPFEGDERYAGSAALRSASTGISRDGMNVSGGAYLDVSLLYMSDSAEIWDSKGFEHAVYMNGAPVDVMTYDVQTLDCTRDITNVHYDDGYYNGAYYGYVGGIYRRYPRYRGHYAYNRYYDIIGYGPWRSHRHNYYGYRGYDFRHGYRGRNHGYRHGNRDGGARGNNEGRTGTGNARQMTQAEIEARLRQAERQALEYDQRAVSGRTLVRPDQLGDRRFVNPIPSGRTQQPVKSPIKSRNEPVKGRSNNNYDDLPGWTRNVTRTIPSSPTTGSSSNPAQAAPSRAGTTERAVPRSRFTPPSTSSNMPGWAPRVTQPSASTGSTTRSAPVRSTRSRTVPTRTAPTRSAPAPRSTTRSTTRSVPARTTSAPRATTQSAPTRSAPTRTAPTRTAPTRSTPARSAPTRTAPTRSAPTRSSSSSRQRSSSSSRSTTRSKPARSQTRSMNKTFGNTNNSRSRNSRNYYAGGGYTQTYESSRCYKEERVSLHIPAERLEAARYDGLSLVLLDRNGDHVPVYIPPNYIEGFSRANPYLRSYSGTPQPYKGQETVPGGAPLYDPSPATPYGYPKTGQ